MTTPRQRRRGFLGPVGALWAQRFVSRAAIAMDVQAHRGAVGYPVAA